MSDFPEHNDYPEPDPDDEEDGGEEGYGAGRTPGQFRKLIERWKREGGDPPEPSTPAEDAIWEEEKPIEPGLKLA